MGNHMKNAIEQMQRKEEAGLNYLYAKTFNYVYLRAKSLLKKETDVQKLMKEVYSQAFASAGELTEEMMYEWLGKSTYALGTKFFRKKKAREASALELDKSDLIIGKNLENSATIEVIDQSLEQLPELYQATFYAFYYDFVSIKEIAAMMDCTEGVILHRLNYTAKYVKEAFAIYNEDAGKTKKEKAVFSVESIYYALRRWSVEHCMGMATAQTLYTNLCKELQLKPGSIPFEGVEFAGVNNTIVYHKADDMSALLAEIEYYSPKEKTDKKKIIVAAAAAAVILLVGGIALLGGKDEENQAEPQQNQQVEDSNVSIDELIEEEEEPAIEEEPSVEEEPTVEEEPSVEEEPVVEDEPIVEEEPQMEEIPMSDEYILPTSNTVLLTEADLAGLTKSELRLARNEIYARHGMIFGVEDLDSYFATKSWYEAKYEIAEFYDNVTMEMLEEANIELILSVEQNMQ